MGSSEPLPIAEGDTRKKKKRKARAAEFLPGKFEGWCHYSLRSGLWLSSRGRSILKPMGPDHRICVIVEPAHGCACDRDERWGCKRLHKGVTEQRWEEPLGDAQASLNGQGTERPICTRSEMVWCVPAPIRCDLSFSYSWKGHRDIEQACESKRGPGQQMKLQSSVGRELDSRDCSYLCCMSLAHFKSERCVQGTQCWSSNISSPTV